MQHPGFTARFLTLAVATLFAGSALASTSNILNSRSASTFSALRGASTTNPVSAVAPAPSLATVGLDVAGIESISEFSFGEATSNYVTFFQLAPFAEVSGAGYSVTLQAFDPSWLSEISVVFTDSAVLNGVIFTPGAGVDDSGTGSFSDSGSLVPQGLNFSVGADGLLRVEFAEAYDDPGVNPDGKWLSGNLSFDVSAVPVPEPGTYGLMGLGLLAVIGAARRRIG